jgi:hypothetical protein
VVVAGGALESEPVGARTALLIPRAAGEHARVAALGWRGSLTVGGHTRLIDGVDRNRGGSPRAAAAAGMRRRSASTRRSRAPTAARWSC